MIEIELTWETVPNDAVDQTAQNPCADISDLEPYFDFLDEIEAFDGLKEKPIHYRGEFEL
ncbi:MAG: hypothetical protein JRJ09_10190 [Deltaproteobacteria bacterium]|nr:hypothetical protein [Deltaproteobacteria bacterium]MBW2111361.1 hypothetical protein [Deltaproteobacteria bacterium]MBW2355111.1 hypothetical protein [Deltaproteobacteria bacterium]